MTDIELVKRNVRMVHNVMDEIKDVTTHATLNMAQHIVVSPCFRGLPSFGHPVPLTLASVSTPRCDKLKDTVTMANKLPTNQEDLEAYMQDMGKAKYLKRLEKDQKRGRAADTKAYQNLAAASIRQHALKIEDWKQYVSASRGPGRRHALLPLLSMVPPEALAYMTFRHVLLGASTGASLMTTQYELGKAVETEIMLEAFMKQNPGAYKWVDREIKRRGQTGIDYRRKFFRQVAKHKNIIWEPLPKERCVQIGALLIELFIQATGILKIVYYTKGIKKKAELRFIDQVYSWLRSKIEMDLSLSSDKLPMIERPLPHEDIHSGGYYTVPLPLVKNVPARRKAHELILEAADLDATLQALNTLDATPYKLNEPVLKVLEWCWEKAIAVGKLPPNADYPLPRKPKGLPPKSDKDAMMAWKQDPKNEREFVAWKKDTRDVHERNKNAQATRLAVARTLSTARDFAQFERFYFPHQLDFRGRIYDMPNDLNPQGPDYVRGLLLFADGKPITDDVAMGWLMIHGANCWGYDKVSLEERIQWVEDNIGMVKAIAEDPYSNKNWMEADKPFQFLAWCFDYVGVLNGEPSYVRVAMDGSCNGLQHLSAMLLDPVGAKAVNLAPSNRPNDIYQEVADVVIEKLKKVPADKKWIADTWLQIGVDRKLTKRSVMVMPYGGKMSSTMKYVEEEFRARLKKTNQPDPFGDATVEALGLMSRLVFEATRDVIRGGKQVMDWLQEVAKIAAKHDHHLHWTTPLGFVARQCYLKHKKRMVETRVYDRKVQTVLHDPTDDIDLARSVNSISPNFVHSMDACALMMTVNKGSDLGITHWHMVHDDYGTHAADTQLLFELLREAFVEMYRDNDVLMRFYLEVKEQLPGVEIPEPPTKGSFDIEQVLESDFFFA